jgi:hypothetical protein
MFLGQAIYVLGPLQIGSLFQGSVVEIEAVNINVRDDTRLQKCKSRL